MSDRVGFFAELAEVLTVMCGYYTMTGLFAFEDSWGVGLHWLLLCAAACCVLFALLLQKPRDGAFLTGATTALALVSLAVFLKTSTTPLAFGYVVCLCVGAGLTAGLPLYYCLHRPLILRHLVHLEAQLLILLFVLLVSQARELAAGTTALMIAVLLLDAAAAVGLRMSDGSPGEGERAFRASLTALGAGAGLTVLIALLVPVFSRSGAVTDRILRAVGAALAAVGRWIERFISWLVGLIGREEEMAPLDMVTAVSAASGEIQYDRVRIPISARTAAIILAVLAAAVLIALAVILRHTRAVRDRGAAATTERTRSLRAGGFWKTLMRRLRSWLSFRWTAFLRRDTPAGVLLRLERTGRRTRRARLPGESMRAFIERMDPSGGLDELSDALDREYYGGGGRGLSEKRCRELRRYIRKAIRHG